MSDNFLARWSRRKRAETHPGAPPTEEASAKPRADPDAAEPRESAAAAPAPPQAFDPASLPPIDEITAATDIRPFLAAGVPPELRQAALRRAWIADPKIRDFVGPADYDWNFNSPDAVPGFGPIDNNEALHRELHRLLGRAAAEEAVVASPPAAGEGFPEVPEHRGMPSPSRLPEGPETAQNRDPSLPPRSSPPADPNRSEKTDDSQQIGRRRHGGALPRAYQGRTMS
jgi:Protein of unknown function (DUF3306)